MPNILNFLSSNFRFCLGITVVPTGTGWAPRRGFSLDLGWDFPAIFGDTLMPLKPFCSSPHWHCSVGILIVGIEKKKTNPTLSSYLGFHFHFFQEEKTQKKNNKEKMEGWKWLGFGGKYIFGIEMRKSTRVREKTWTELWNFTFL